MEYTCGNLWIDSMCPEEPKQKYFLHVGLHSRDTAKVKPPPKSGLRYSQNTLDHPPPFLSTCPNHYLYSNIIPSLIHCSLLALYSSDSICYLSMIFYSRYSRISMKDQPRMVWEREGFSELIPAGGDLSPETCDSSSAFKLLWDQDALRNILTTERNSTVPGSTTTSVTK